MRVAGWRWAKRRDDPIERAAVSRYFAGVCRNKARKADEAARRIHVTWPSSPSACPISPRSRTRSRALRLPRPGPTAATCSGPAAGPSRLTPATSASSRPRTGSPPSWPTQLARTRRHPGQRDRARSRHLDHPRRDPALRPDLRLRAAEAPAPRGGLPALRLVRPGDRAARRARVVCPVHDDRRWPHLPAGALRGGGVAPRGRDRPRLPALPRLPAATPVAVPKARCPGYRTPPGGIHHPDRPHQACPACGERITSDCASRGHRALRLMPYRPVAQAMATLRRIKPRSPDAARDQPRSFVSRSASWPGTAPGAWGAAA